MANLIKIKLKKEFDFNKNITNYLNPDYIYIPYDKNFKLHIKEGKTILKESVLLSNGDKYIYSPISGVVKGAKVMMINEKKVPSIIIENDFKEKVDKLKPVRKDINKLSIDEFNDLMLKYSALDHKISGTRILINGIDYEPYEQTYKNIISRFSSNLLEAIDAIYEIFSCTKCTFAIPNNKEEIAEKLIYQIGTYPNIKIKLTPDLYPAGHREILIREIMTNDDDLIYLTVEQVLEIYNVLKKRKPVTEKIVTIAGDSLEKSKVVNLKLGTNLRDVLDENFKITNDDYKVVINGLLSGYESKTKDVVITKDMRSIFIHSESIDREDKCINCGACHTKCPVKCDPRYGFNTEYCIECGICNYVCPSKKKLR